MQISASELRVVERIVNTGEMGRWRDWRWQLKHTIRDIRDVEKLLGLEIDDKERAKLDRTIARFPMAVTPYYLSLIDLEQGAQSPIYKQSIPSPLELRVEQCDLHDPLSEDHDSPVPGLTHRYPDRVLFLVSNACAMYCRHCTRKRRVGDDDYTPTRPRIEQGLAYIREHSEVRDVLLSGGDPFLLPDKTLDWILTELRRIDHVEVIRIGTRTPAVLPYRITDELVAMLRKHHPLWINCQFNHPQEITRSSQAALAKLADAGFPLGNQSVLLADVNDCPRIMKSLLHKLVRNRVRPYYLYQCDLAEGLAHFRTPIGKGIEIMESLIGHTSGFAIPTYVVDVPGGGGKIPMQPNYLISWSTNKVILRNYEGVITSYREPDRYEAVLCDRHCADCKLQLALSEAEEIHAVGIERLLADDDDTITLTPMENDRHVRREDWGDGDGGPG